MIPYWEPGTQYNYGDKVSYNGQNYKIIQPHRSQGDWTPDVTPALWGRMQGGDDGSGGGGYGSCGGGDEKRYQPSYSQPQVPQFAPQPAQPEVQPTEEEKEKHWYDLDDERKKQLEVGGGLLAGIAALGAGYVAYQHHNKSEEEKKAHVWALNNWLRDAQARTRAFYNGQTQGPVTWIYTEGKNIPQQAIPGGQETYDRKGFQRLYICRAYYEGGLLIGKASSVFKLGAVVGYKHEEIHLDKYEILVGDMNALKWVNVEGELNLSYLGARPVEGGKEPSGAPIYIAKAYHKDAEHPGKACTEYGDGCFIPYGNKEVKCSSYQVLCYNY